MVIKNEFNIKQTVYIITDSEQKPGFVTSIEVLPNDLLIYNVSHGQVTAPFYAFELSVEKDVLTTLK